MAKSSLTELPDKAIISKIYLVRNQKVMIDRDLADLYGVATGNLNKAVKRNIKRFPPDFMFQLSEEEFKNLIFQNGISKWGGTRNDKENKSLAGRLKNYANPELIDRETDIAWSI